MTEYVSFGFGGRERNVHSATDTTAATTAQLHLFLAGLIQGLIFVPEICVLFSGSGEHTGCSVTTFWLLEGAAGLVGCMVTVLAFQFSVGSLAGADLKKLKLNIVVVVVCV